MRKSKTYRCEVVAWDDHAGPFQNDTKPARVALVPRITVGFVMREDASTLVIAGTVDENGGHDMTAIGKALVTSRQVCGSARVKS